jgi:diamine N-acetyltransferase
MKLSFKEIKSDSEIKKLSLLASKIWNAYYPDIIGQKQVDYMLGKMYSEESLRKQINYERHYFIGAYLNEQMAGFISYSKTNEEDFFLHKLYVNTETHSKGIGRALFDYVFGNRNFKTIRLTVNRQNIKAINFYFKKGFVIEKIIDMDIGEGYMMNDFVMVFKKQL